VNKAYIGDGVYADVDEMTGDLVLTTENGIEATNRIVLEPAVLHGLEQYIERRRAVARAAIIGRKVDAP